MSYETHHEKRERERQTQNELDNRTILEKRNTKPMPLSTSSSVIRVEQASGTVTQPLRAMAENIQASTEFIKNLSQTLSIEQHKNFYEGMQKFLEYQQAVFTNLQCFVDAIYGQLKEYVSYLNIVEAQRNEMADDIAGLKHAITQLANFLTAQNDMKQANLVLESEVLTLIKRKLEEPTQEKRLQYKGAR